MEKKIDPSNFDFIHSTVVMNFKSFHLLEQLEF